MHIKTSPPKHRPFWRRTERRYLLDFARGHPTNPAWIPVGVNDDWYGAKPVLIGRVESDRDQRDGQT
jgi:hypothetical protein